MHGSSRCCTDEEGGLSLPLSPGVLSLCYCLLSWRIPWAGSTLHHATGKGGPCGFMDPSRRPGSKPTTSGECAYGGPFLSSLLLAALGSTLFAVPRLKESSEGLPLTSQVRTV
jgi:hypothetical protein